MKYIIDAGSKSIKLYKLNDDRKLDRNTNVKYSYHLNQVYSKNCLRKMIPEDQEIIISIFNELIDKYNLNKANTKIFATGHFRYIRNLDEFKTQFAISTNGLYFNVVSQELETFYQDINFIPYSNSCGSAMVIAIGGGSIQISFYRNGKIERSPIKLSWGTNALAAKYPKINDATDYSDILEYVKSCLPIQRKKKQYNVAFLPGGEITYMKNTRYPITSNDIIDDTGHPFKISFSQYEKYNQYLFSKMSIEDLKKIDPNNPYWMDGAKPYSIIAQAICEFFSVPTIIPSNANIIDGIIKQEFRNVVLCGSYNKHMDRIGELAKRLSSKGIQVLSPKSTKVIKSENEFVIFDTDELKNHSLLSIESPHIDAIKKCDAVIICNFDGYIGEQTGIELGHSLAFGKKIIFLEEKDTLWPIEIGLL